MACVLPFQSHQSGFALSAENSVFSTWTTRAKLFQFQIQLQCLRVKVADEEWLDGIMQICYKPMQIQQEVRLEILTTCFSLESVFFLATFPLTGECDPVLTSCRGQNQAAIPLSATELLYELTGVCVIYDISGCIKEVQSQHKGRWNQTNARI